MSQEYTLIGVDGGATKVSAWIVNHDPDENLFTLTDEHAELNYSVIEGFIPDFQPETLAVQLGEFQNGNTHPTSAEKTQGETYVEACARVIKVLAENSGKKPVLIGLGMPGLKTADKRGIAVVANGPRITSYASELENKLLDYGLALFAPVAHIGSDADYCGIGEKYARDGSFLNIQNAYYLGGGTGAADAMLLDGNLVPFDLTKSWLAKTWEMKNEFDLSLERYASASGLQHIYSMKSGIPVEKLNAEKIYPAQIANQAIEGEKHAMATFSDAAKFLSLLFYERIESLFCGSKNIFKFVNPNRPVLESTHPYLNQKFDRIVVGQRLGNLLTSRAGNEILTTPLIHHLSDLIDKSETLSEDAKQFYLHGNELKNERLVISPLREAPALGAGIDAFLVYRTQTD